MKPETRSFYERAVRRAVDHLVTHLDDAVDLDQLANSACLSPFHFHRIFRGMVGETPLEFARRLRLERAAWALFSTDAPVTAVAFDAGYETHEAFTRAFRANFGAPPSDFRRTHRPGSKLAAPCGIHFGAHSAADFIPRNTGGQTMDVEIEQLNTMRLATVRHVGPYNQIGKAFEHLGGVAGPAGLFQHPTAAMIAIYHDSPESTPADELRSDAGIAVPEGIVIPKELGEERIPAGRYARTTHIGAFDKLGDVWARFMGEWLPASGERVGAGPAFEIYRSDMRTTPMDQFRTDLYVPLT